MKKFFNPSSAEHAIIAKEEVLLPDYVPTEALHRTNEMKAIAEALNPLTQGRRCSNLFVYGPSGTGKTTCMKLLIEQLGENTAKTLPVYVNCWEYPTKMAVYSKISDALKLVLPRRGLASDEVFERILEAMKNQNLSVLVVLDELDSLIFNKQEGFLYNLSRSSESGKAIFGIVGISNKKDQTYMLDARIASSLRFSNIEFKEYGLPQLVEILSQRAKAALMPDTCDKAVLEECAKIGAQNSGNARLALEVLWKAAVRADKRDAKKVELEDVQEVAKAIEQRPSKRTRKTVSFEEYDLKLSDEEKMVLEILSDGEKASSEIYEAFKKKAVKSKRQIRNYLMILEAKGLIDSKEIEYRENSFLRIKLYFLKNAGG